MSDHAPPFLKLGTVRIRPDGRIEVCGFQWNPECREGRSCRQTVQAACSWAMQQLADEMMRHASHHFEEYRGGVNGKDDWGECYFTDDGKHDWHEGHCLECRKSAVEILEQLLTWDEPREPKEREEA